MYYHDNTVTQLVVVDMFTQVVIHGSCKHTITIEVLPPVVTMYTECTLP